MSCTWSSYVNKKILDSTTVTVGESATLRESLESGGLKKTRLLNYNPPDKYEIVMAFDFSEKKSNGYTELENFYSWYKTVHKFGTIPFQFPAILINSNRQTGYSIEDVEYGNIPDKEYYCITSAVQGSKSGNSLEIKMTWETYATGFYQIPDDTASIYNIIAKNGAVEIYYTSTPDTEPSEDTITGTYTLNKGDEVNLTFTACIFDGDCCAILYFDKFTGAGTYTIIIENCSSSFVVEEE